MSRILVLILFSGCIVIQCFSQSNLKKRYEVAVYYFPDYHVDSVNEKWHGKGWTEWDLVRAARPRFPGHLQPRIPEWGYFDESDPKWAAKEIDLAADHGIDVFVYDWYWYESTGPYLRDGLEKGFLKAPNNQRLKFALMWANHDWANIHPTPYTNFQEKLTDGRVSEKTWDMITDYIIKNYFSRSNYWKIDGKPYFSIFATTHFIESFGSVEKAAEAIKRFEEKTVKAGFPGLHLNCIDQGITDNSLKNALKSPASAIDALRALHASSVTSYNFLYAYDLSKAGWPTARYKDAISANVTYWNKTGARFPGIPYYPNVTMGWDVTPRTIQSDKFDRFKGYPWTPVFNGDNTPEAFEAALKQAREFADRSGSRIIMLNAWNEWTEGSYLLPDTKTKNKYLEAINQVFR
ncbi:MAG TPA: glycoside hydrolase family 99-like domain-containing protein [Puia sp.]|nr:glycoside hydrolase family 99-like domain-containing protein [Puia sp.]